MTLKEFLERQGGYIKDKLDEMQYHAGICDNANDPGKVKDSNDKMLNCFYVLFGYLSAAYDFGHITHEEDEAFRNELNAIMGL